jgi:ABC-type Fe3+ transport system permease subunit
MTHRHYGVRGRKPPAPDTGPTPGGVLSGGAIIGMILIILILIVLGVVLYGVSKTVTDAVNTATSAPRTTGQAAPNPPHRPFE